jgi:ribosomal protein S27AE
MSYDNLTPVQMFCPNCGAKVIGYKSADGAVRMLCDRCYAAIFSKKKNERVINIQLTAPTATQEMYT